MAETFFEQPILNSPYEVPTRHHDLDEDGQPTNLPPIHGPASLGADHAGSEAAQAQAAAAKQREMVFADAEGLTDAEQEYNPTPIINEIRDYVDAWRQPAEPERLAGDARDRAAAAALAASPLRGSSAPSSARSRRSRRSSG